MAKAIYLNNLYAITAYYIYQQCFKEAKIIKNGNFEPDLWPSILRDAILKDIGHHNGFGTSPEAYDGYIRDRFRKICTAIDNGRPLEKIRLDKTKFELLLKYSKTEDYEKINESFDNRDLLPQVFIDAVTNQPINIKILSPGWISGTPPQSEVVIDTIEPIRKPTRIPVVAVKKPFNFFNLLRIPDKGELCFHPNGNCEYIEEHNLPISLDILQLPELYTMPGDQGALWVKVNYEDDGQTQTIYFAEPQPDILPLKLADPQRILDLFKDQLAIKASQ